MEPWAKQEVDLLIQAVEKCGSSVPMESQELEDDHQHRLHLHQLHGQDPDHQGGTSLDHDMSSRQSSSGPLSSLATTGALIAHAIDWTAVSNKLAEDFALKTHAITMLTTTHVEASHEQSPEREWCLS